MANWRATSDEEMMIEALGVALELTELVRGGSSLSQEFPESHEMILEALDRARFIERAARG